MIAALRMRPFLALLLLASLLPGLLVPAGMLVHVCRCAPRVATDARACCAADAESERTPCCRAHDGARTPAPDAPHHEARCGCVWLPLPAPDFDPSLPDLPVAVAPPTRDDATALDFPWARYAAPRAWPTADSRPPPPHRERNLPLRS